jgi:hypothetical protein
MRGLGCRVNGIYVAGGLLSRNAFLATEIRFWRVSDFCRGVTLGFDGGCGKGNASIFLSRHKSARVSRGCDEWDADERGLGGCSRIECEDGSLLISFFYPCESVQSVLIRVLLLPVFHGAMLWRALSRLEWLKATIIFGHPAREGVNGVV